MCRPAFNLRCLSKSNRHKKCFAKQLCEHYQYDHLGLKAAMLARLKARRRDLNMSCCARRASSTWDIVSVYSFRKGKHDSAAFTCQLSCAPGHQFLFTCTQESKGCCSFCNRKMPGSLSIFEDGGHLQLGINTCQYLFRWGEKVDIFAHAPQNRWRVRAPCSAGLRCPALCLANPDVR